MTPAEAQRNRAERIDIIRRKRQRTGAAAGGSLAAGGSAACGAAASYEGDEDVEGVELQDLGDLAPAQAAAVVSGLLMQFKASDNITIDRCAEGFLKALMFLRVVLAEDMAAMCAPAP